VKLLNINMPLPLDITTDAGMTRTTIDKKGIVVISNSMPLVDTRVFYLKKVIYE